MATTIEQLRLENEALNVDVLYWCDRFNLEARLKRDLQQDKANLQEEKAKLQDEKVKLQKEKAKLQEEKANLYSHLDALESNVNMWQKRALDAEKKLNVAAPGGAMAAEEYTEECLCQEREAEAWVKAEEREAAQEQWERQCGEEEEAWDEIAQEQQEWQEWQEKQLQEAAASRAVIAEEKKLVKAALEEKERTGAYYWICCEDVQVLSWARKVTKCVKCAKGDGYCIGGRLYTGD
jgi:hypothetical protein